MAIEWHEQYGIHDTRVGRLILLQVCWRAGAYVGTVSGYKTITLKPCADLETAKRNTLRVALNETAKLHAMITAELAETPTAD